MEHSEQRVAASANQTRYVKAELTGTGTYMIPVGHLVAGKFDADTFRAAADAMVGRHDALRTHFDFDDGAVYGLVSEAPNYQLHICEMSDESLPAFRDWALPHIFDDVNPRKKGSLVRFLVADFGTSWRFTIAAHHAITDGFSRGVMSKELLKLYAGEELTPAQSYYAFSQPDVSGEPVSEIAQGFVRSLPKPSRFVSDGVDEGGSSSAGQIAERDFGDLHKTARMLGKSIGATKFGVLSAAYALGLYGFTGEERVSSFFQTEGRKYLGAPNSVVGPFSNTLPLDLSVDPDGDFASLAKELSARVQHAVGLENESVLDHVLAEKKAPSVSINMYPPMAPVKAGALDIGPREYLDRRAEFDLNLMWSEDRSAMTARAFFNAAQLSQTRVELFLELQGRLLDAAIADPQQSCREILKAARAGKEAVVHRTTLEPEPQQRLHEPFFDWAARTPDATAMLTSKEEVTYSALAGRARAVMAAVIAAGAGEGDRVAIFAQRDPRVVEAMMGISASGASFALIDSTYPLARISRMIAQLDVRFIIEAGATVPEEVREKLTIITPSGDAHDHVETKGDGPRASAYHLFTSGTTGQPKLITHPDKTVQRFVAWQAKTLALTDRITTVMMAGLAHDPTLRDILLPLSNGGKIAIPTPCEMADPEALRALISRAQCNVMRLSPSSARLLTTGMMSETPFSNLKAVFWGGERLSHLIVEQWQNMVPEARQFNVFGTTETPQAFLIHEVVSGDQRRRVVPTGKPLPWTGVRLVADDGSPVSLGETGEIVAELADPVGGINQKYLNDSGDAGGQHYTGDMGYQMPDGLVYFVGRRDGQVSINGFRVELGEVEVFAEGVTGVERASAILVDEKLHLFVLTDVDAITEKTVRAALSRNLPTYMVPTRIFVTDTFPFTANGKIDKDALVQIAQDNDIAETKPVDTASMNALETTLSKIFAKRSGRPSANLDESLFDLGADSLSTIETRLDLEELGLELPEDWPWMTIAELAKLTVPDSAVGPVSPQLFKTSRVETMVLLRALAIIVVVMHHTGITLSIGASIVLFALAGFSFGRLQIPAVLKDDHSGRVWALIARILIPMTFFVLIYAGINAYRGEATHPSALLFYRNLVPFLNEIFFEDQAPVTGLLWLWFLHAYLQIFVFIGILLSFPGVRSRLRGDPWPGLLVFFVAAELVSVALILGATLWHGDLGHMSAQLQFSPTTVLPFIAVGALAGLANTPLRRAISIGCALLHFWIYTMVMANHSEVLWVGALIICIVFPFVPLPKIMSKAVITVAAFSLMIYLTHVPVQNALSAILGQSQIANLVSIVVQILSGIALGMVLRPVLDRLGINRLAAKNITFGQSKKG